MDNHIASKAIFIGKFVFTGGILFKWLLSNKIIIDPRVCQLSTVKNTFWFSTNTFVFETNTYMNVVVTAVCEQYFSFLTNTFRFLTNTFGFDTNTYVNVAVTTVCDNR